MLSPGRPGDSPPPLPNLLVAGAQKSGTTSLHHLLAGHPEVFFPPRPQEIHFFDLEESYARGLSWYRELFAGWGGEPWIGQTSPLYLFEPAVPGRIAEALPEARLVFILRDPVRRAYSHYWHEVRYGWESLPFEEALDREEERLARGPKARRHFSYTARGLYSEQLARFVEHCGRERFLILFHEELKRDPAAVAARCAAFLGLDPEGFAVRGSALHHNPARLPRIAAAQRWVRRPREPWPRLGYLVDRLNLRQAPYPPLPEAARERLAEAFRFEAERLEALLGVDARRWWKSA